MKRARTILIKILTLRVSADSTHRLAIFRKNCFAAIFGDHFEFLLTHKNVFILETERAKVISMKVLTQRVSAVYW